VATPGSDLRKEIFGLAVSQNLNLLELNKTATTLEDVFLCLTSSDPTTESNNLVAAASVPPSKNGVTAADMAPPQDAIEITDEEAGDE
jgi:hypothetical protein